MHAHLMTHVQKVWVGPVQLLWWECESHHASDLDELGEVLVAVANLFREASK